MRHLLVVLPLLASCAVPPASSYVTGVAGRKGQQAVDLGVNQVGESCVQASRSGTAAEIYCGTWQQPSGHVRDAGPASAADLASLATTSPWRANLEAAYACQAPQPLAFGSAAVQLSCTRRAGGWPHFAAVILSGGRAWQADGVVPALSAIERSVAILSGQATPTIVNSAALDALQAQRAGSSARASGDVRAFDSLMVQGGRANLADDPAAAEAAYGAAVALQRKALGPDNPNLADPEMHLALQLSNQHRFGEAARLFADAEALAAKPQTDPTLRARLKHYEALDAINQHKNDRALGLLGEAEAGYRAALPPGEIRSGTDLASNAFNAGLQDVIETPQQRESRGALAGLVEVLRYKGEVLRSEGKLAESEAAIAASAGLARSSGVDRPNLMARVTRATAVTASVGGKRDIAMAAFSESSQDFLQSLPDSRPLAHVGLLHAREFMAAGRPDAAVASCRAAVKILVGIRAADEPESLSPCLDAFAAVAARAKDAAARQDALRDMFQAAQLVRGSTTSQQIQLATARLAADGGSKVGEAIRDQQDAAARLAGVRRLREAAAEAVRQGSPVQDTAALDAEEKAALADSAARESALQEASPNYGQLVQAATSASDVLRALRPGEAFAAVILTEKGGWTFVLRDGMVQAGHIDAGAAQIGTLVERVRKGMEPGLPAFDVAAAAQIYTSVFGPVQGALDGVTAMTVAPTGSLLSLPFGVMLTGPADPAHLSTAPWLVRTMAIGHVPSAANFVALRRVANGSKAPAPWFGFGDFQPVTLAQARRSFPARCGDAAAQLAGLPPLPSARQELEVARRLTGAGPQSELLGAAFTVPAVKQQDLSGYRVLHFATHAILPTDLQCETEPALVTSAPRGAPDAAGALLKASDLAQIKLDADVVILSACNSGGSDGSGAVAESLSALARSFFYGGARSLLITHWEVNDQAATLVVADTLRRLRAEPGLDVAGALQNTQLNMIKLAGSSLPAEFAHPFFWAPFAVIGQAGVQSPAAGKAAAL